MDIKEAMKILKKDIHTDLPKSATSAKRHNKAIEMAIDAISKQIPMRPIDRFTGDEWICMCPECAGITDTPNEVVVASVQYCAWCGQKLDWSEENNENNKE